MEKKEKKVIVNTLDDVRSSTEKLIIKLGKDRDYYKFRFDVDIDWENTYKEKRDLLDREERMFVGADNNRLLSNIQQTLEGNASVEKDKHYHLLFVVARPRIGVVKEFPALLEVKEYIEDSLPEPFEYIERELETYGYRLRYKCEEDVTEAYWIAKSYLN